MNNTNQTNLISTSTSNTFVKELMSRINFYYPIVLSIMVTVGNIISFMVFSTSTFRNNASSFFIKIKLVNDLLNVYIGTWRYVYLAVTGVELKNVSVAWCYIVMIAVYYIDPCSSWLNVFTSLDRLALVLKPSTYKSFSPQKIRKLQIIIIVVMYFVVACIVITTRVAAQQYTIDIKKQRDNTTSIVVTCAAGYPWVDYLNMVVTIILPFISMTLSSLIIAFSLIKSKLKLNAKKNISNKNIAFIKTVLVLDAFFLIFNLPRFVFQLLAKSDWLVLGLQIATIFKFSYYSISFVFFIAINNLFRQCFLSAFDCFNLKPLPNRVHTGKFFSLFYFKKNI